MRVHGLKVAGTIPVLGRTDLSCSDIETLIPDIRPFVNWKELLLFLDRVGSLCNSPQEQDRLLRGAGRGAAGLQAVRAVRRHEGSDGGGAYPRQGRLPDHAGGGRHDQVVRS